MNARRPHATWAVPVRRPLPLPTTKTSTGGIDWIAVERAITGDYPRPHLTREERCTAAIILIRAGFTEKETARLVEVAERQIARWKFQHGLGGASTCAISDCYDLVKGRGLCHRHYRRDLRRRHAARKQVAA
ncbi:hypothetical protein C9F11_38000 [Streptomyces sp. YIM 121038]|uniref:hypothetical protein n=1 Tax=Streptomyces sp. YIM 121038 TaxID=2136401 RepID=UPI001110124E|nr:hypothetical protein [Streptomyces sp. YIM 121038]QCX81183.1 hypothetical protein C9F11_38000 [Streptomyces sp. YIM 121038]